MEGKILFVTLCCVHLHKVKTMIETKLSYVIQKKKNCVFPYFIHLKSSVNLRLCDFSTPDMKQTINMGSLLFWFTPSHWTTKQIKYSYSLDETFFKLCRLDFVTCFAGSLRFKNSFP